MTYRSAITAGFFACSLAVPLAAQERDAAMGKTTTTTEAMTKDHGEHGAMIKTPKGSFAGAEGHRAKGSYEIASAGGRTQLKLGGDFSVEKGPDVHVVLSPTERVPAKGALFLGKLTRFDGAQSFDVPAGTDLGRFTHVVLWCRKYSVAMATAPLAVGDAMMMDKMEK